MQYNSGVRKKTQMTTGICNIFVKVLYEEDQRGPHQAAIKRQSKCEGQETTERGHSFQVKTTYFQQLMEKKKFSLCSSLPLVYCDTLNASALLLMVFYFPPSCFLPVDAKEIKGAFSPS